MVANDVQFWLILLHHNNNVIKRLSLLLATPTNIAHAMRYKNLSLSRTLNDLPLLGTHGARVGMLYRGFRLRHDLLSQVK